MAMGDDIAENKKRLNMECNSLFSGEKTQSHTHVSAGGSLLLSDSNEEITSD